MSALALADRIEGIVGMLGLPSAIGSFDLPVQALPTVAALLEEHYPTRSQISVLARQKS